MEWRAPGAEEIWGFWIGLLRLLLDNGLFGSLEVPVEYPDFAVGKPQEQQWFKDFTLFLCIYPPCSLFKLPVWWCWCCSLRHSMNQIINWSGLKIILQHREEGRSAGFFFSPSLHQLTALQDDPQVVAAARTKGWHSCVTRIGTRQ